MKWKLWIKLALATVVLEGGTAIIALYASYSPQPPFEVFMLINGILCLAIGIVSIIILLAEEYG